MKFHLRANLANNIDLSNIRFSCLDGTNTMPGERIGLQRRICNTTSFSINVISGERIGLQRRIHNVTSFSIYVNCRCNCLTSCLTHLFDQFPWLQSIGRLLCRLQYSYYSGKIDNICQCACFANGLKRGMKFHARANLAWF